MIIAALVFNVFILIALVYLCIEFYRSSKRINQLKMEMYGLTKQRELLEEFRQVIKDFIKDREGK